MRGGSAPSARNASSAIGPGRCLRRALLRDFRRSPRTEHAKRRRYLSAESLLCVMPRRRGRRGRRRRPSDSSNDLMPPARATSTRVAVSTACICVGEGVGGHVGEDGGPRASPSAQDRQATSVAWRWRGWRSSRRRGAAAAVGAACTSTYRKTARTGQRAVRAPWSSQFAEPVARAARSWRLVRRRSRRRAGGRAWRGAAAASQVPRMASRAGATSEGGGVAGRVAQRGACTGGCARRGRRRRRSSSGRRRALPHHRCRRVCQRRGARRRGCVELAGEAGLVLVGLGDFGEDLREVEGRPAAEALHAHWTSASASASASSPCRARCRGRRRALASAAPSRRAPHWRRRWRRRPSRRQRSLCAACRRATSVDADPEDATRRRDRAGPVAVRRAFPRRRRPP